MRYPLAWTGTDEVEIEKEVLPMLWWKKAVANSDDDEHGEEPSKRERERKKIK